LRQKHQNALSALKLMPLFNRHQVASPGASLIYVPALASFIYWQATGWAG
jgi:hypothetical protein